MLCGDGLHMRGTQPNRAAPTRGNRCFECPSSAKQRCVCPHPIRVHHVINIQPLSRGLDDLHPHNPDEVFVPYFALGATVPRSEEMRAGEAGECSRAIPLGRLHLGHRRPTIEGDSLDGNVRHRAEIFVRDANLIGGHGYTTARRATSCPRKYAASNTKSGRSSKSSSQISSVLMPLPAMKTLASAFLPRSAGFSRW